MTYVPFKQDGKTKSGVILDYPHHENHDGNFFRAGGVFATLAAATDYDVAILVPAGKELHFHLELEGNTECGYSLYEDATYNAGGGAGNYSKQSSPGKVICKNRSIDTASTVVLYLDATFKSGGSSTLLTEKRVGSGKVSGGDAGSGEEWILTATATGKAYIARFSNFANPGTMTGWWKISWYVEDI